MQPIAEIGRMVRESCSQALFHTDATQAVGKIPIDLQTNWQDVDLASFSAHKFHGPKGVGGLYIRPGVDLGAMLLGGGQEEGRRSGTTNTPGLAGLAAAAANAQHIAHEKMLAIRDRFEQELLRKWPEAQIHSGSVARLPNTSFFSLPSMAGEEIADALAAEGIIIGTGAACSAGALQTSKTLRSMGVPHDIARASLRVSLSQFSTDQDVDALLFSLVRLRTPNRGYDLPVRTPMSAMR